MAGTRPLGRLPAPGLAPGTAAPGPTRPGTTAVARAPLDPSVPPTRPRAPRRPTVLDIGDSLGIDLGWGLQGDLAASGARFVGAAVGDTGLAEPWYYSWPYHLAVDVARYRPRVVVVFLGANDAESYYTHNTYARFGTPAWAKVYAERVSALMTEATAAGAKVLWVGMPVMSDPGFSAEMAKLNQVYEAQAAAHPGVSYLSAWAVLSGPSHRYEETAPGPGGVAAVLRDPDGIHLTTDGADLLARAVVTRLKRLGWL